MSKVVFPRRINAAGLALIKEFEGLRLRTYLCPGGVLTIGYGHTRGVKAGMFITEEEAEQLLDEDLREFENAVASAVVVKITDNQFSALVSFTFNVGITNFECSTLLRLLNRGWYEQIPKQMMRWNKANGEVLGGLAKRRAAEGRLWSSSITHGE